MDINNAPATVRELHRFVDRVTSLLDAADPDRFDFLLAVDHGSAVAHLHAEGGQDLTDAVDQLTAGPHRLAAMVSLIGDRPAPGAPARPAWVIVAVGRNLPALSLVRPVDAPEAEWEHVPNGELPWLLLSTASGLRSMLAAGGSPLAFKTGTDGRLFGRPDEVPDPPLDGLGRL